MNVEKEPDLTQVIEAIVSVAKETPNFPTHSKGFRLLEAMTKICKENEPKQHELTINYLDLGEHLHIPGDKEGINREVRRLHKYIDEKLTDHRPALESRLHKANHREFIELVKVNGKSKLILKKVPLKAKQSSMASESTVDLIQYEPKMEKTLFGELDVEITKKWGFTMLALFIFGFAASYLIWWFVWYSEYSPAIKIVTTVGLPYIWYLILNPFYQAFEGATITPFWLRPSLSDSLLLVEKKEDSSVFRLTLKSYTAKCPICGSKILISKGKHQMKGRLVGKCKATSEHLYTFDHVKERGVPARTPMYLPK